MTGDNQRGKPTPPTRDSNEHERRNARLAQALRENLRKRKAQARARRLPPAEPTAGDD